MHCWVNATYVLFNQSWIENQVAALAFPADGLVIGNIITF